MSVGRFASSSDRPAWASVSRDCVTSGSRVTTSAPWSGRRRRPDGLRLRGRPGGRADPRAGCDAGEGTGRGGRATCAPPDVPPPARPAGPHRAAAAPPVLRDQEGPEDPLRPGPRRGPGPRAHPRALLAGLFAGLRPCGSAFGPLGADGGSGRDARPYLSGPRAGCPASPPGRSAVNSWADVVLGVLGSALGQQMAGECLRVGGAGVRVSPHHTYLPRLPCLASACHPCTRRRRPAPAPGPALLPPTPPPARTARAVPEVPGPHPTPRSAACPAETSGHGGRLDLWCRTALETSSVASNSAMSTRRINPCMVRDQAKGATTDGDGAEVVGGCTGSTPRARFRACGTPAGGGGCGGPGVNAAAVMAGRGGALPDGPVSHGVRRVTDGRSKFRDAAGRSRNLTPNESHQRTC